MEAERSIPDLTKDVASSLGDLLRNEVRLARAEAMDALKGGVGPLLLIGAGLSLAAAALTVGLFAIVYAIGESLPMWASALVAALLGGLTALLLIQSGRKALAAQPAVFRRTTRQVSEDLHVLKETVTS